MLANNSYDTVLTGIFQYKAMDLAAEDLEEEEEEEEELDEEEQEAEEEEEEVCQYCHSTTQS
jgi:hypothetical protein